MKFKNGKNSFGFDLTATNTNGNNRIVVLSLAESSVSILDTDLLLAFVDDVAVFAVRKSSVKVDVVEVAHGKEALLASAEPEAAILDLPVLLFGSSNGIGKL
jgi:hypothetical protein